MCRSRLRRTYGSGHCYSTPAGYTNPEKTNGAKASLSRQIHIGLAGGIGTPQAAVAAFMMGADFILTGSINQCTVEAGTSDCVKNLLQEINVQDTDYAPAGDMFELGAKAQVLKKAYSSRHGPINYLCSTITMTAGKTYRKKLEHR